MSRNCQREVNSFGDLTAVQARFESQRGCVAKKRMAGRAISRILSGMRPTSGLHTVTIIPLVPQSLAGSSGLPEG